jgi:type IV pilus assembly protein PilN
MRVTLNLATRPFADLGPAIRRLRIGIGILAGLAIVLALGLHAVHHRAEEARARAHSLDGAIARVESERQSYQALMQQPDNHQLLVQTDDLNKLFDEKAFSWTLAMENLETVLPGGVQVSSIEPIRAKDGHITLHLRVIGPHDRSVELVRNLENSKRFLQPRIVGETSEASTNPNQRMEPVSASNRFTFDLFAEYNPPTADEAKAAAAERKSATASKRSTGPRAATTPANFTQQGARPAYTGPARQIPPGGQR